MRIFLQELRKLFRPTPLLAVLAILLLFGQSTFYYYLRSLPKTSSYALDIYTDWRERYGKTLDPEELPEIRAQLEMLYEEADETIAHWHETQWAHWESFSEEGITNYQEYRALLEQTERDLQENNVAALLLDSRTDFLQFRISLVENLLDQYDFESASSRAVPLSDRADTAKRIRCEEIAADPAMTHSILYSMLLYSAQEFAVQLALVLMITVSILVSPYLVRERLCRMAQLQWPSRTGRRVIRYQLAAALAISALISVVLVLWYGVRYCISWRVDVFWDCIAYSIGGSLIPWFRMTYGQYLLLLGALLIVLGIACGAVMFFLSRFSGNYIAMLLKAIPLYLAFAFLADKVLSYCLYFGNDLSGLSGVPGAELLLTAVILVLALVLVHLAAHREQARELL